MGDQASRKSGLLHGLNACVYRVEELEAMGKLDLWVTAD